MRGCTDYSEEARRWREPGTGKARPVRLLIALAALALLALVVWLAWPKPAAEGFSMTAAADRPSDTAGAQQAAGTGGSQQPAADAAAPDAQAEQQAAAAPESSITVYLTGAVLSPGIYQLAEGARLNDAVLMAGGLTADASANYINLASPLQDGAHLHIPTEDEVASGEADRIATGGSAAAPSAAAAPTEGGSLGQKVNINTADAKQLVTLPGIGEALAKRIVDYRTKNGSFASVEDLKNVSGIGDKKFEELADKICV